MAKPKSADFEKDGAALDKLFKEAKNAKHQFALVYADKGMRLAADKKKKGEQLLKEVRKLPGAKPKGFYGEIEMRGSAVVFKHIGELPLEADKIAKDFRAYLGLCKIKKRETLIEPLGGKGAEPGPGKAEALDDDALKKKLSQDLDHIEKVFEANYEGLGEKDVKDLQAALKAIRAQINGDDLVKAQDNLNKLRLLTGVSADTPIQAGVVNLRGRGGKDEKLSPEDAKKKKKELTKEFANLKSELQRSLKIANPEHKKDLEGLLKSFSDQMKANDLATSETTLETFRSQIENFDKKREEGVAARKPKLAAIRKRAEEIKARLEEIANAQGAA